MTIFTPGKSLWMIDEVRETCNRTLADSAAGGRPRLDGRPDLPAPDRALAGRKIDGTEEDDGSLALPLAPPRHVPPLRGGFAPARLVPRRPLVTLFGRLQSRAARR